MLLNNPLFNNTVKKKKSKLYHILTKNRNKNHSFPQTSTKTKNFVYWVNPKHFVLHQKGKGNDKPTKRISSKTEKQQTSTMKEEENNEYGRRIKLQD